MEDQTRIKLKALVERQIEARHPIDVLMRIAPVIGDDLVRLGFQFSDQWRFKMQIQLCLFLKLGWIGFNRMPSLNQFVHYFYSGQMNLSREDVKAFEIWLLDQVTFDQLQILSQRLDLFHPDYSICFEFDYKELLYPEQWEEYVKSTTRERT
jgi:hypothetical protein